MQSLRLLQAEVEFSVTPLPQALTRVANRSVPPVNRMFDAIAVQLGNSDITVADAFELCLHRERAGVALKQVDLDALQEFGETLGTSDRVHQTKQFAATLAELERLEREARESQRRHERLWQYLGILTGLLLLILLY